MAEEHSSRSRYDVVILSLFEHLRKQYGHNAQEFPFSKALLDQLGEELQIKNIPDIIYSYRSGRRAFPEEMLAEGEWIIRGAGKGRYVLLRLNVPAELSFPYDLETTVIPDATPEIMLQYAKGDEQSTLVQVRYNRLIDVFTALTAYHLQSHVRAYVEELGQVEVDDLYLAVNTDGQWFCVPVEAKSATSSDQLGRIQISAMVAYVQQEFPDLAIRPVGIKKMPDGTLFFAEFTPTSDPVDVQARFYKRYLLVRDRD